VVVVEQEAAPHDLIISNQSITTIAYFTATAAAL
jgi:hypothetical protein